METNNKLLVFVVEDDLILREMLTDRLKENEKLSVKEFTTGEKCLECLGERPDLVILDYHLDTIQRDAANGVEILQSIKKELPATQVIMCSSQDRYGVAVQSIGKGACHYIIKDENTYNQIDLVIEEILGQVS